MRKIENREIKEIRYEAFLALVDHVHCAPSHGRLTGSARVSGARAAAALP
jgi:hypothetical protein